MRQLNGNSPTGTDAPLFLGFSLAPTEAQWQQWVLTNRVALNSPHPVPEQKSSKKKKHSPKGKGPR